MTSSGRYTSSLASPSRQSFSDTPRTSCSERPDTSSSVGSDSTWNRKLNSYLDHKLKLLELKPHISTPTDSTHASQSSSPIQSVSTRKRHIAPSVPPIRIPDLSSQIGKLTRKILIMQMNTFFTHCQVLLAIAQKLEHQALSTTHPKPPQFYYDKMETIASRARKIAKDIQSEEHQARAEYWTGRAHGGNRDYSCAIEHFQLAIDLDVHGYGSRREGIPPRGLTWEEKSDVRFLLASVKKRQEIRQMKVEGTSAHLIAEIEAERTGRPINECLEWAPDSPVWAPERDYVVHKAKRDFDGKGKEKEEVPPGAKKKKKQSQAERDHKEATRKTLNAREWWYIKHGDVPFPGKGKKSKSDGGVSKDPSQSSEDNKLGLVTHSITQSDSVDGDDDDDDDYEAYSPLPGKVRSLADELAGLDEEEEDEEEYEDEDISLPEPTSSDLIKADDANIISVETETSAEEDETPRSSGTSTPGLTSDSSDDSESCGTADEPRSPLSVATSSSEREPEVLILDPDTTILRTVSLSETDESDGENVSVVEETTAGNGVEQSSVANTLELIPGFSEGNEESEDKETATKGDVEDVASTGERFVAT